MRFDEVQIPAELQSFITRKGLTDLYPPQEEAVKAGLLDGKSLVVASPTASGKTLIALMAAFVKVKLEQRKVVYLAPLRALASEKYAEFSELSEFGIRTAISTGDYDMSGESLGRADIIVLTNERFDSILRHRVSWLHSVGLFIADEVHLAGNDSRGPTLEMILTKVLFAGLDAQILSLSATISNAKEIAEWLRSRVIELSWRPVPLREGVFDYGRVVFTDGMENKVAGSTYGPPIDVALDTVKGGGQSLIFANTRRRAVSLATKGAEVTQRFLTDVEKTAFFFVTLPEALPIAVIRRFIAWFADFGIPIGGVVVNGIIQQDQVGPDAPAFVRNRVEMQRGYLREIDDIFSGMVRARLPLLETEVRGVDTLGRLSRLLYA